MPKGGGKGKGKGPVPRNPRKQQPVPKRPAPSASSSDEDDWGFDLQAILARMQALEQAKGIVPPAGKPTRAPKQHETRAAANKRLQADILQRLSILEGGAPLPVVPVVPAESPDAPQSPPVDQPVRPMEQPDQPSQPVPGPSQPKYAGFPGQPPGMGTVWPWGTWGPQPLPVMAPTPHTVVTQFPAPGCGLGSAAGGQWAAQGAMGGCSLPAPGGTVGSWGSYAGQPSWPASYMAVPAAAIPFGDVALPLGDHLLPATRDKICRGEFVDLFSLLFRELEKKDKDELDDKDKEKIKKRTVDRTWANWLPGFLIFAGILARSQPWRAAPLFQYLYIIYKGYTGFSGPAWLQYDEEFRMRAAMNPALSWDQVHPQLWLQVMSPAWPTAGDRSHSGHLVQHAPSLNTTRSTAGQVVQPRLLCWEFGAQGVCGWKNCTYRHECSLCGGQHAFTACFRGKARKGQRRPVGGGNPPGKGPQPHKTESA